MEHNYTEMVDLKKDLDEYLLLQSDQKKSFKIQIPTIQKPSIGGWFKKNQSEENGTWFQETKKECCPSLVIFNETVKYLVLCLSDFSQGFSELLVVDYAYAWAYFASAFRQCIFLFFYLKQESLLYCLHWVACSL